MVVDGVESVLEEIRYTYNAGEFDYTKTHTIQLCLVDEAGVEIVVDFEAFIGGFDPIVNCSKRFGLSRVEFYVLRFAVVSDSLIVVVVKWDFFNHKGEVGLVREVGYVVQKRDDAWKISAVLQPTFRDPIVHRL
jgi:hypothetical protein